MKKLILIVSVLLFFVSLNAQIVKDTTFYFNQTFFADTSNTLTPAVEVLEDGYMLFGGYVDAYSNRYTYVKKINELGEQEWFTIIESDENGQMGVIESGTQVIQYNDKFYLTISYDTTFTGEERDINLYELDLEGNLLSKKTYGKSGISEVNRVIMKSVFGGFCMGGVRTNEGAGNKMYLIRIADDGSLYWDKEYAENWGQLFSLKQTPWDGGFIFSGFSRINDSLGYDLHTIKVDNLGEVIWEKTFGNEGHDSAGAIEIITDENGNFENYLLIAGANNDESYITSINDTLVLYLLDEYGEIEVRKTYPELGWRTPSTELKIKDDKVSFVKYTDNTLVQIDLTTLEVDFQTPIAIDDNPVADTYLKDIQFTSDGGYVMAGYHYSPLPQKSWVVKVDSLGNTCGFANCDSLVIVETIIEEPEDSTGVYSSFLATEKDGLLVFPNPASQTSELVQLFLNDKNDAIIQSQIYDIQGKQLFSNKTASPERLTISGLQAGVYLIRLRTRKGVTYTRRLLVQ